MTQNWRLREALDAVGRRLYRKVWTDEEADATDPPSQEILGWGRMGEDAKPEITPEQKRQIRKAREKVEPRPAISPEDRAAWERREEARQKLRDFIRHSQVRAWLHYHDGTRQDIEPPKWEAREGPLWLNYSASIGGYSNKGTGIQGDAGEVWIDRDQLEVCLLEITPVPVPRTEQKRITSQKHSAWVSLAGEIAREAGCPKFRGKPNVSAVARRVRMRGTYTNDAETIRKVLTQEKSWRP